LDFYVILCSVQIYYRFVFLPIVFEAGDLHNSTIVTDRTQKLSRILMIAGAVIFAFVGRAYLLGFLLGAAAGWWLFRSTADYWNDVVDTGFASAGTGSGHFLLHYLVMGGVLVLCALQPAWFNIFTCALGMVVLKISVILDAALEKKGEKRHGNTD
jgi:hypothetical protein